MADRREWVHAFVVVGLLFAGFALKGWLVAPPAVPAVAQAGEFDSPRALARLQRILGDQRPHPVDSAANDSIRERLIAELRAIGLEPRIQDAVDCSAMPKSRAVSCSRVRNVVATVAGNAPGRHLLLNSHYDSTPTGPGAADDGIGIATMLEVAGILQTSPPPRPVTFLFNEGEEFGLNGAAAFVRSDPLADNVNSLINIEARGVSGPAIMFETSEPSGGAIALYQAAARRPYANSLTADFAKLIPNTTDVVKFRPNGWTLLNYAVIGNETRYHTPGDTIAALDRASLHHMGSEVLAAARVFARTEDPSLIYSPHMAFTDLHGRSFIALPLTVAAIVLALLLLGALVTGHRCKALGKPLLFAAGMTAGGIATAVVISVSAGLIRDGDFWRAYPVVTYLAEYTVLLAAMGAIWLRWGRRLDRVQMRAAAWLLILLAGSLLGMVVPGASIFFLLAPAIALAGMWLLRRTPLAAKVLLTSAAMIHFLWFAQLLALIEMLLIDGPLWAVAPLAALGVLPALIETDPNRLRPAVLILIVAAFGLWAAALVIPRASAQRPAAFTIDYFLDADRKSASWAVASKQAPLPESFPGEWRKGVLPYNMRTRWISPAPLLDAPQPNIRLLSSEPIGKGRRIRFALSPGGGNAVAIRFAEGTKLLALGRPGQLERIPPTGEPKKASLRCSGRSCDGFVVEALFADRASVALELFTTRFTLPAQAQPLMAARPANAHPQYAPDSTIVLKRAGL